MRISLVLSHHLNPSLPKELIMTQNVNYPRLKYVLSYILAMGSAYLTFELFYMFEGTSNFGLEVVALNFLLILFLWILSFVHTNFIENNFFMALVLPLLGLQIANLMLMLTSAGTNALGYIGFVVSSFVLIFSSYAARKCERVL